MAKENTDRPSETILMTGATGFLGSWIISRLVDQGIRVIATDVSDDYRRLKNICPDLPVDMVDFRRCDVTDAAALNALISETKPSGLIHLAALQIPVCREKPAAGAMVNVVGHINVFEAARQHGIKRVIYTSSIAAKPRGPANAPSNLYGVFKKADEEIARIYWQDHEIPSLGLRPYIVYGVGRDDGETSAITRAIEAAALEQKYEIPFNTTSCFQFAGDIAHVIARAIQVPWKGALLSDITEKVHSIDDVVAAIQATVPGAGISIAANNRVSPSDGFDTSPLRHVIGDWQETSLEDGVRQTATLYRTIAKRTQSNPVT